VNIAFLGANCMFRRNPGWPATRLGPRRLVHLLQDELPARPDVREGQRAGSTSELAGAAATPIPSSSADRHAVRVQSGVRPPYVVAITRTPGCSPGPECGRAPGFRGAGGQSNTEPGPTPGFTGFERPIGDPPPTRPVTWPARREQPTADSAYYTPTTAARGCSTRGPCAGWPRSAGPYQFRHEPAHRATSPGASPANLLLSVRRRTGGAEVPGA